MSSPTRLDGFESIEPGSPPGLQPTKVALLRLLLDTEQGTADLARAAGLHPTVVRRHMRDLSAEQLVEVRPVRASAGRPRLVYRLSALGREVLFPRYGLLLECLTRGALGRDGMREARALFRTAAKTLGRDLGFPRPVERLLSPLREVGFQPELRRENGDYLVVSRNCPVFRLARNHPDLLCEAFHSTLLEAGVDRSAVELRQTMARGAPVCIHVVTYESPGDRTLSSPD